MKIYKYLLGTISSVFLITLLAGCGIDKEVASGKTEGNNGAVEDSVNKEQMGIVSGSLKTEIKKVEGAEYKYVFSIQNDKEKDQLLVFPSSQEYDYTITNEDGTLLYTFGMNKSFIQTTKEKVLKSGEKLEFDIDLIEGLQNVQSGKYKIEVWATLQNSKGLKSEVEIDFKAPDKEAKQVVNTTLPVTYVGQIDGNSIEIKNEEGIAEVYRLSEVTKDQVNKLSSDNVITIDFITDANGLRVAQSFTVVSD